MRVYERQPYSGKLVFAAFSGSHQDAIAKGMKFREAKNGGVWNVPYLPIDPADVGRVYEADVIRINSQSGKGGIGYILETRYHHVLPPKMREAFGYHVKSISDHEHRELMPHEVYDIFVRDFVNQEKLLKIEKTTYMETGSGVIAVVRLNREGTITETNALGNGRLDAMSNAIKKVLGKAYTLEHYTQHALEESSTAQAAAYVGIRCDGQNYWGAGIDSDIIESSVQALVSAVNRMLIAEK
jgi:2-isopropylmalate synthase